MRIAITGIGGVGGYFGGLLARHYSSGDIEIIFIARGENEKIIQRQGLKMQTVEGDFTVHPRHVTSDPSSVGTVDLLICCIKGYDLEQAILQCKSCINKATVLLPLLNGVNAKEKIQKICPANEIWEGCVYLVSRLAEPGFIRETGNVRKMFFGSVEGNKNKLLSVEKIFRNAGIDATWSQDILSTIWEKFLFISPIATVTSYLDKTIGEVFGDEEGEKLLQKLLVEIKNVADAKGIVLPGDTMKKNIDKMRSLPPGTTSSMHSDFRRGGQTELDSLTGYVIRLADEFGVSVPAYEMMFEKLNR